MPRFAVALLLIGALAQTTTLAQQDAADEQTPRTTELIERTETRLTQIDVTVSGPPEVVTALTPEDFSLKINLRKMKEFQLDRLCSPADVSGPRTDPPTTLATAAAARATPVSYLFFFDQVHLTLGGRARGIDVARKLIGELIHDGSQGMLVSNARRLEVIEPFTQDPQRLVDALKRLENDREQWQFYAEEERSRVDQVVEVLNNDDNTSRAVALARTYQREELWRTDKSLRRMAMTLSRLNEVPAPKAVILFSDTLRDNPGQHYLAFFGGRINSGTAIALGTDGLLAKHPFDKLVNAAVAQSIRFYPVLAQGLVNPQDRQVLSGLSVTLTGSLNSVSRSRQRDVQNSLASLATETGGHAFIYGDTPAKVARRILDDFSCLYLISFDPAGFARDVPLRVVLESLREDVKIFSRGRVVVQSESARRASRLLSAFLLDRSEEGGSGLQSNLVPTGYENGVYSALLQISVPGTTLPNATWDVGASMVARDKVREQMSGRMAVEKTGVPLVLEQEVNLSPGAYQIISVAHETVTDFTLSDHREVDWPDPDGQPATCGPFAVLQPTNGAFLRDGTSRGSGSLAHAESEPMRPELPTALMGLICRGRRQKGTFTVERTLVGASIVKFPPLEFDFDEDRCAQVRDMIPANALGPGGYRYEVRVLQDGSALHQSSRAFYVLPADDNPSP